MKSLQLTAFMAVVFLAPCVLQAQPFSDQVSPFIIKQVSTVIAITDVKMIDGTGEINVSHLAPGIYYLKDNATGVVQKISVIKK